jgi:hypothetical protein
MTIKVLLIGFLTVTLSSPLFANETLMLREGTEVRIKFNEKISSDTSVEGDQFVIEVDEDVDVDGKVVIPAGSKGRGEVTQAKKKGFMGKGGELNIRLNYVKVGDKRVRLTAQRGKQGDDKVGTTVALTVLFGPLGLLKRGKETAITPGQTITAFVDRDIELPFPAAPIPVDD